MALDARAGVELIEKAREADQEDRIRAEWVALLPWMQSGHLKLIQFGAYLEQRTGRGVDTRPASEIIAELEALHGRRLM